MRKKPVALLDKTMMSTAAATAAEPKPREPKDYGEPLNFRVPPEFGQQFRMVALRQRMKLQQLLKECFEVYIAEKRIDL
jgi:hypothetical protein